MDLTQFMEEEQKPKYTPPAGKSKTWLADVEVHFMATSGTIEYWHADLISTDGYSNELGDDLECYSWGKDIMYPEAGKVYVTKAEFHGKWYETGGYCDPVEWDADFWVEKELLLGGYEYEEDENGDLIVQEITPEG